MKKAILVLCIVAGLGAAAHAQDSSAAMRHKQMKGGKMEMFQELNLSEAQKEKVKTIMMSERTRMNDIRNNTTLTDDQRKEQMQELRKDQRKQIESQLTPEQKTKWQKMEADRKKNFKMKNDHDSSK